MLNNLCKSIVAVLINQEISPCEITNSKQEKFLFQHLSTTKLNLNMLFSWHHTAFTCKMNIPYYEQPWTQHFGCGVVFFLSPVLRRQHRLQAEKWLETTGADTENISSPLHSHRDIIQLQNADQSAGNSSRLLQHFNSSLLVYSNIEKHKDTFKNLWNTAVSTPVY